MDFDFEEAKKAPAFNLYFRRYAPFAHFGRVNPYSLGIGGTFEGDNRGPSTSPKDSSRTYGVVMFSQRGLLQDFSGTSGTRFNSLIGSDAFGMAKVSMTMVRSSLAGPGLFEFEASTAGGNPLIKPSPDINTYLTVRIDFGTPRMLRISGNVFGDNFPALEVFVLCLRSQHAALLVDGRVSGMTAGPNSGPMTRLWGASRGHRLGAFENNIGLTQQGVMATNYWAPSTPMS